MKRKCLSLLLAAALMLSLTIPGAFAEDDVLHISTAKDLKDFARNCTLVEYSAGLSVVLDEDIDLEGRPFSPIPSFSGSFDGGGHTIKNFVLATDGSHQGLFRYLRPEGSIKDLKLEGRVEPDNSRCQVGGLVGSSGGLIENCSFDGKVTGLNYVGGIAGENYGSINGCSVQGSVSGKRFAGGIAGFNAGSISGCENYAEVNTGISAGGLELDKLNMNMSLTGAEDTNIVSDSGGICGYSTGLVENSVNSGMVGYPHYGYNVGGIAGRQSGHICGCTNLGEIYGRKDVAGIVGQMEPNLRLLASASLAGEIQTLQAMVSNLLANAGYFSDEMRAALGSIKDSAGQTLEDIFFPDGSRPEWPPDPEWPIVTDPPVETDPPAETEPPVVTEPPAVTEAPVATEPPAETAPPVVTDPPAEIQPAPEPEPPAEQLPQTGTEDGTTEAEALAMHESSGGIVLLGREPLEGGIRLLSAEEPSTGTGESGNSPQLPDMGDIIGGNESLKDNLDQMSADMDYFNSVLGASADSFKGDLNAVSYQLSKVLIMMTNALSGAGDIELYDDVSEKEPDTSVEGRVKLCVNRGRVEGDSNVGGIAGDMGVEYEFDLENELMSAFTASNIISSTYQSRCIASEDKNYGEIIAKKENVGGIAGQCQVGLIESCEGYGAVSSGEAGFVGGIVGNSMTLVRNSYAMCRLDGREYVGGIAGYGVDIKDRATLISADGVTACCGAIAGWADMNGENSVKNNFYTHPELGAVDGLSYEGRAEALGYEALLALKGLPEDFGTLKLSFVADGQLVAELPFEYGGDIDESALPAVPEKRGYSGRWADYNYSGLCLSDSIEAVYTSRQGTLAANTAQSGSERATVLVEGDFDSKARLNLREFTGEGPALEQGSIREKWVLDIDGSGTNAAYRVHYLCPEPEEKRAEIALYSYSDGVWSPLDAHMNGSYLVFDWNKDTLVFSAVEMKKQADTALMICGGAVALLAVVTLAASGAKRKKKAKAAAEEISS